MNKAFLGALAVGAILFTTSCSNSPETTQAERSVVADASASPSPTIVNAAESSPADPSEDRDETWEEAAKRYAKDDIKFTYAGATKAKPYGVSYPNSRQTSWEGMHTLGGAELEKATRFGMEAYQELRTDPAFFKHERTVKADHAALSKHKDFDQNILDELKEKRANKELFDWIPAYSYLTADTSEKLDGQDAVAKHLIDTARSHEITVEGFNVDVAELTLNGETGVSITYSEVIRYDLSEDVKGEARADIEITLAKPAGKWKLHGMSWNNPEHILKDDKGKTLH